MVRPLLEILRAMKHPLCVMKAVRANPLHKRRLHKRRLARRATLCQYP
jgi:hypothetical protein